MKRIFLAVLLVLAVSSAAFAISDREYGRLLRESPEFYEADQELNRVWDELKDELSARKFAEVKRDQNQWIKNGRDSHARRMIKRGYSRAEAYTDATLARANYLKRKYLDY